MYELVVKPKARKELEALPREAQQRIVTAFEILCMHPFSGKKLHGDYEGARSLRVWPYRIIYTIHREIVTVTVLRVGHRQRVYAK